MFELEGDLLTLAMAIYDHPTRRLLKFDQIEITRDVADELNVSLALKASDDLHAALWQDFEHPGMFFMPIYFPLNIRLLCVGVAQVLSADHFPIRVNLLYLRLPTVPVLKVEILVVDADDAVCYTHRSKWFLLELIELRKKARYLV